jgi:hypothetical protein
MRIDTSAASSPVDLTPRLPFLEMDDEPNAAVRDAVRKCPGCGYMMHIETGCTNCNPNGRAK